MMLTTSCQRRFPACYHYYRYADSIGCVTNISEIPPYKECILRLNGLASSQKWSSATPFSSSKQHKFRTYKSGKMRDPEAIFPFWWLLQSRQDHMEADAQVNSDALVLSLVWSRSQQHHEVETGVVWWIRHELSLSAWNLFMPILSNLQKGVKAEYSRGLSVPELLPDLVHSQECKHVKGAHCHFQAPFVFKWRILLNYWWLCIVWSLKDLSYWNS